VGVDDDGPPERALSGLLGFRGTSVLSEEREGRETYGAKKFDSIPAQAHNVGIPSREHAGDYFQAASGLSIRLSLDPVTAAVESRVFSFLCPWGSV
jgi:hypothetical protein